jgi:hypothetical protein
LFEAILVNPEAGEERRRQDLRHMARVRWEDLSSQTFEDMTAVLINVLYPDAERIDGAGGDGGRDVQIPSPTGLIAFELKSFTGRLGEAKSRRKQVIASLKRARALRPKSWTLVVPIDPTPGEHKWFDGLKKTVSFPIAWLGKTWLDARMAQHPYVPKYFVWGGAQEVVEILKELKQEEAALTRGVLDVVDRAKKLADRLNELDAYYSFSLTIESGSTAVRVRPRFRGAEKERPILISVQGQFPTTPDGRKALRQFQDAINFGSGVTLSPEFIKTLAIQGPAGLSGTYDHPTIELSGAIDDKWRMPARFSVVAPDGAHLASLPMIFNKRRTGIRGGTAYGQDNTGALTFELSFDLAKKAGRGSPLQFHFSPPDGAYPSTILPVLHLLQAMRAPNVVLVDVADKPAGRLIPSKKETVPDYYVALMEALDRIQAASGTYFEIPARFSPDDLREIAEAEALLDGKPLAFKSGTMTMVVSNNPSLSQSIDSPLANYQMDVDYTALIAGHKLALGHAVITLNQARVEDRDELISRLSEPPGTELKLRLVSDKPGEIRLVGK